MSKTVITEWDEDAEDYETQLPDDEDDAMAEVLDDFDSEPDDKTDRGD